MLKAFDVQGILWLTHVRQVTKFSRRAPKDWQSGVIFSTQKWETGVNVPTTDALLTLAYAKCLKTIPWNTVIEPKLNGIQYGFRPGRSTTDQIFTFQHIFKKPWEYMAKTSTQTHVLLTSRKHTAVLLWKALESVAEVRCWRSPVTGRQVTVFLLRSLFPCREVKSQPFTVDVGLRQGCVLSPFFFIVYMNWINSHSQVVRGGTIGSCRINCLLFADDLELLASFSTGSSTCTWSLFCCVRPSRNENQH